MDGINHQKWVVYDIAIPTLMIKEVDEVLLKFISHIDVAWLRNAGSASNVTIVLGQKPPCVISGYPGKNQGRLRNNS